MIATETHVTGSGTPPVTLRVREHGPRTGAPHVLLLHGYPDDQTLWDDVVAALPRDWHVVTVDNRGAGGSTRPPGTAAYAVGELVEDVAAVVAATVPAGEPVHLVGHDWGAVTGWEVVAAATWDPRFDQLASYTAVSGICLDHVRTRAATWRGRRQLLPQALHSWYVALFCLPRLPELLWRRGQWLLRRLARRLDPTSGLLPWGRGLTSDAVAGLALYRALARSPRAAAYWRTSLPVLVVHGRHDGFLTLRAQEGLEARCRRLVRVALDTGHWVPRSEPDVLARLVQDHVGAAAAPTAAASPAPAPARAPRR
ncbi:alpha/beta fold hydrolase [Nocardioides aequoreus]|uniref:alpha/beta fold hydrolase n=1 Tax=Nocardioides aequoreus TaxID=397278 RepID=UPI00068DDEEB|nr:alpha/beta fold hydrolase [Nocardioides aequoreus]